MRRMPSGVSDGERRSRYTDKVKENPKKSKIIAKELAKLSAKILAMDYGRTKFGLALADEVTRFAERVRKQAGVPVELVDERLTSWEAERILEEELGRRITHQETHLGRKKTSRAADTKYTLDAVAAMVILREYLSRETGAKEQE
jgi:RNase H-fold protein (predicted Holliday junction resolvase)